MMPPSTFIRVISACIAIGVSGGAVAEPLESQTSEAAMEFLIRVLPGLKMLDTWEGGWMEAKYDRARAIGRCKLEVGAPFAKIHSDFGEVNEAPLRQSWLLDFSKVTGVGQRGTRAIYKVAHDRMLVLGVVAMDATLAGRIARAMENLRLACMNGAA
jgi:hypothetical protein